MRDSSSPASAYVTQLTIEAWDRAGMTAARTPQSSSVRPPGDTSAQRAKYSPTLRNIRSSRTASESMTAERLSPREPVRRRLVPARSPERARRRARPPRAARPAAVLRWHRASHLDLGLRRRLRRVRVAPDSPDRRHPVHALRSGARRAVLGPAGPLGGGRRRRGPRGARPESLPAPPGDVDARRR